MSIPNLYPASPFRPLSDQQTEPRITPRILVFHTMVGYLRSTERYFRTINGQGFVGAESTWGVGGSWDGPDLDGTIWQWQGMLYQADAQFLPANNWCNSVETSDGGIWKPRTLPWTNRQIATMAKLGAWWCHATGVEPVIAKSYDGRGLGYHQLFRQWNTESHNCPGPARVEQFRETLVPTIQKLYHGDPPPPPPKPGMHPAFPLGPGQAFGTPSFLSGHNFDDWQRQMRARGWAITPDGFYGPQTKAIAIAFQKEKGLVADGLVGRETWDAAWLTRIT